MPSYAAILNALSAQFRKYGDAPRAPRRARRARREDAGVLAVRQARATPPRGMQRRPNASVFPERSTKAGRDSNSSRRSVDSDKRDAARLQGPRDRRAFRENPPCSLGLTWQNNTAFVAPPSCASSAPFNLTARGARAYHTHLCRGCEQDGKSSGDAAELGAPGPRGEDGEFRRLGHAGPVHVHS